MLVDMGAEVIKIEDPNGGDYARWYPPQIDGQSAFFRMNNRGKRSVILNLKDPKGQEVLQKLTMQADVVVESFRPGVTQRLGCDYPTLKAINPRLVYCSLSGWGADGPDADLSGHDLNYVSVAGIVGTMATPQVPGGQFGDMGGAYAGVAGILAALLRRERTGEGGYLDVSLAEAALPFMLYNWTEALVLNTANGKGTLTGGLACYHIYKTRDSKHVALAALEPKFWENFCHAIERNDLIDYHQQAHRQTYLTEELKEIFALKTAAEWQAQLGKADCCFSLVNAPHEISDHPQFQARGALGRSPDGSTWMRSPIRLSDNRPPLTVETPGYGEHTREVLLSIGYTEAEIKSLMTLGIVK
jgi:crotonobetainyl-CoA:carnitine CoA-transferase CaiB-like acyl-CoA transferase